MLVIVHQPSQEHHGRTQVHVVGEEIAWLGDAKVAYAGPCYGNEGASNLRLNVAVVLREVVVGHRDVQTERLEEEVGVTEEGEARLTRGVGHGVHVDER